MWNLIVLIPDHCLSIYFVFDNTRPFNEICCYRTILNFRGFIKIYYTDTTCLA